jgi:hypothetical protein
MDYLVDASGRNGLISTKYLKNRSYNKGLRNVASWGYWKGGGVHGVGTHKEGAPYFEALKGRAQLRLPPLPLREDHSNSKLLTRQMVVDGYGLSLCTTVPTQ